MKSPCNSINILLAFLGSYLSSNALCRLANTVQNILDKALVKDHLNLVFKGLWSGETQLCLETNFVSS